MTDGRSDPGTARSGALAAAGTTAGEQTGEVDELADRALELVRSPRLGERKVPFVDLKADNAVAVDEIDAAIAGVLDRCDFILGDLVTDFEEAFAAYCGAGYAVGVDSGFSALELILRAYAIGPGDEVITAANTFIATVGAIHAAGATPVVVDVLPSTGNIDPEAVRRAVTGATRAIVPVHLYGRPADMEPLNRMAAEHGLVVIEDACQAHGARYDGGRAGSLADAAAFSFYPSKNLGAFGDGGMVVTDHAEVARSVTALRNLGSSRKYHHESKGFNHRLDTLQAAVLAAKLPYLDRGNAWRRRMASLYERLLTGLPVTTPHPSADDGHVFHLYVIEVPDRDDLQAHLASVGVSSGIHYPVPVHHQPAYSSLGNGPGSFPVTERAASRILSLPMYATIPMESVAYTAAAVRAHYEG